MHLHMFPANLLYKLKPQEAECHLQKYKGFMIFPQILR